MKNVTVSNREIATMAFDLLCNERKTGAAIRLARDLLHSRSISLGISDRDWDIDTALQRCGGEPRTGYRHTAYFHLNQKTEMPENRYKEIKKEIYGE